MDSQTNEPQTAEELIAAHNRVTFIDEYVVCYTGPAEDSTGPNPPDEHPEGTITVWLEQDTSDGDETSYKRVADHTFMDEAIRGQLSKLGYHTDVKEWIEGFINEFRV